MNVVFSKHFGCVRLVEENIHQSTFNVHTEFLHFSHFSHFAHFSMVSMAKPRRTCESLIPLVTQFFRDKFCNKSSFRRISLSQSLITQKNLLNFNIVGIQTKDCSRENCLQRICSIFFAMRMNYSIELLPKVISNKLLFFITSDD